MRTAIVYYSQHHGNTKKLLDAISDADISVTLINAAEKIEVDLRDYDRIGLASDIYTIAALQNHCLTLHRSIFRLKNRYSS